MASQSAWLQGSRSQPVTCLCVCVCFRCVWHCLPLIAEENTPWGKTLPLSSLWTEIQPRDRNLLSKEPSCRWHLNLYVHKGSSTQKISEYLGGNKIFFQRISIELLSLGSSRQIYWSGLPFPSPGDLPTQGSKLGFLHCRQIRYQLSCEGGPGNWRHLPWSSEQSFPHSSPGGARREVRIFNRELMVQWEHPGCFLLVEDMYKCGGEDGDLNLLPDF